MALDLDRPQADPIPIDQMDDATLPGFGAFDPTHILGLYTIAASDQLVAFRIPEHFVDLNGNGRPDDLIRTGAFDLTRRAILQRIFSVVDRSDALTAARARLTLSPVDEECASLVAAGRNPTLPGVSLQFVITWPRCRCAGMASIFVATIALPFSSPVILTMRPAYSGIPIRSWLAMAITLLS